MKKEREEKDAADFAEYQRIYKEKYIRGLLYDRRV